ncbi:MAG: trehalose-phosphatase, partial [Chloroflexota bacterium]
MTQDWQQALADWITTPRLGLITDVDGTISPIAETPEAASVTDRSRELLAALVDKLPLVGVISGRAAADVQARVGVDGVVYMGNHGMERWVNGTVEIPPEVAVYRPRLEKAITVLRDEVDGVKGMILEDKGVTLSLHYRRAEDHDAVLRHFRPLLADIEEVEGLSVFEGRMIFEIRPPVAANKGTAFRTLVESYSLDAAVYVGDDTTDVDAIEAARDLRAAGV